MKLIIDIPEDTYQFVKDLGCIGGFRSYKTIQSNVINAIKQSIPYEKGKIADAVYKELDYMYCDNCRYNSEVEDIDDIHCENCHRKSNGWAVSRQVAEDIEKACRGDNNEVSN